MRCVRWLCVAFIFWGPSSVALAGESYNFREGWMKLSEMNRDWWAAGMVNGQEVIIAEAKIKQDLESDLTGMDPRVISEIMTECYKDPANSYIPWKYMTQVAKMKLKGKSATEIEMRFSMLREYGEYLRLQKEKQ